MKPVKMDLPDLADFVASKCTDTTRTVGSGGMSIVYSSNGKRLTLNAIILNHFRHQKTVQIAYADDFIAIANYMGESNTNYAVGKSGKNGVIYNAALVKEIVNRFRLDFSSRTSMTFPVFDVQGQGNETTVYIQMKSSDALTQD
jgi:hypothetical protein